MVEAGFISWLDIGFFGLAMVGLGVIFGMKLSSASDKPLMALLVALLRDVQYLQSRALIELPRDLDDQITRTIGAHPRDGG